MSTVCGHVEVVFVLMKVDLCDYSLSLSLSLFLSHTHAHTYRVSMNS